MDKSARLDYIFYKMTKILQISNYYPPDIGGIEIIAKAVSDALRDCCELRVLCFSHEKTGRTDEVGGVTVTRCGTQLKVSSQQLSARMPFLLRRILREYAPDAVILHMPNPFLAFLTLRLLPRGTKLVTYWHSDIVRQKKGERIFRRMFLRVLERSAAIVATSPDYIRGSLYLRQYSEKCVIIPNCIDEDRLRLDEESEAFARALREKYPGKILLAGLGQQVGYKGFPHLVRALRLLDDRFVLFLVGRPGDATPEILREAEGMENVILTGMLPDRERNGYLSACDIFCFPSVTKNEAFGVALAEALYCGKPAVTFTIPGSGVNYVNLNGVTGIEVPNRDEAACADALRTLADDPALRKKYGTGAARRARELFLFSHFSREIRALIGSVCGEEPPL